MLWLSQIEMFDPENCNLGQTFWKILVNVKQYLVYLLQQQ